MEAATVRIHAQVNRLNARIVPRAADLELATTLPTKEEVGRPEAPTRHAPHTRRTRAALLHLLHLHVTRMSHAPHLGCMWGSRPLLTHSTHVLYASPLLTHHSPSLTPLLQVIWSEGKALPLFACHGLLQLVNGVCHAGLEPQTSRPQASRTQASRPPSATHTSEPRLGRRT